MIDSGEVVGFGPEDEFASGGPRLTMQRVGSGYVVKSGDGLKSYTVASREEAEAEAVAVAGWA